MNESNRAEFQRITEDKTKSPDERLLAAIKRYQFTSGVEDFAEAMRFVTREFPELHREYLDTVPTREARNA